jgi:putative hemin transport protein
MLPTLGPVVAITRNGRAVVERRGTYGKLQLMGTTALVLNRAVDVRVVLERWQLAFAVDEGRRQSLQFFDSGGAPVHTIVLGPTSNRAAYDDIVTRFASVDQTPGQRVVPRPAPPPARPDTEINVMALRAAWGALRDAHDFAALLRTFSASRLQALRLAGREFAYRVAPGNLYSVLCRIATAGTAIRIVVANSGAVQVHSGPIHRVETRPHWLVVCDPDLLFRVRSDRIASAWVVSKPTRHGLTTSLELFDADGENIALLFGARDVGEPDPESWRAVVGRLSALDSRLEAVG